MLHEMQELIHQYTEWLKAGTSLRELDGWVELTTPFLDRRNDFLQIYAHRENGHILLTDDSYIINDLELSGCSLNTPKRHELLQATLNGFGVSLNEQSKALEVKATPENFGRKKHSLIQAMLAVNDLFYLAEPLIKSLFFEDVVSWLDLNDVRYTQKVKFSGKSGYDHVFDFVIPKSKQQPERIIRTINRPSRDAAEAMMHAWSDTRAVRPSTSRAYALLNDKEQATAASVVDALRKYDIHPILWSRRDEARTELVA